MCLSNFLLLQRSPKFGPKMGRLIMMILTMMILWIGMTGCLIGVKERIVYVSIGKFPEELNNTLRVGTNKKIPVVVAGTDVAGKKNMGGYCLVHPRDLKAIIDQIKKLKSEIAKEKAKNND